MLLWLILAFVLGLWLLGWTVANLGNTVHLLLLAAAVVLIARLLQGRRAA